MNVYFTVDTEASMGGAWSDPRRLPLTADRHIFCRVEGRDYGIGFLTDMLGEYGYRATHFVETLMTLVNGHEDVASVFDFLLERDQDVQLHLHPTYRFYAEHQQAAAAGRPYEPPPANDFLGGFDEGMQLDLIEQGAALFERFAGRRPIAFRAGSFAANRVTMRCLRRAGVRVDSSFNPCYRSCSFPDEQLEPNQICDIEGVSEVPVTVARTPLPEGYGGLKHADPSALSFGELRAMLEHGVAAGQKHFVIILHSFSAVKHTDVTFSRIKPDRLTISRLKRLLRYLSERPNTYRVSTLADLASEPSTPGEFPRLAELPLLTAGIRKSMQGLNRLYWV